MGTIIFIHYVPNLIGQNGFLKWLIMLSRIKIVNFLLIEQLELDFYSGLTVVTGETGSGKSIIIDALMLLFGAKVPKDIIRNGQVQANFEAEFKLSNENTIKWLSNNDLVELDCPENVICRRVIDNQGKNKAYINGHSVTATQIKALGELILDIHVQHASITLLKSDTQRSLLDEYVGINTKEISLVYKSMIEAKNKLNEALSQSDEISKKQQSLEAVINDLLELKLTPNEWEELNIQQKQLNNSENVLQELDFAQNILQGQEPAVIKKLGQINIRLNKISEYVPKFDELITLLSSAEIELQELSNSISIIAGTVEQDPSSLKRVESRINQIYDLGRKHRILPEQIIDKLSQYQAELKSYTDKADITQLQADVDKLTLKYNELANAISLKRNSGCLDLGKKVTEYLHKLALTGEFIVSLNRLTTPGPYGFENVEYQVCFNKGMAVHPLAKAASGGELSRTALALYLLLSIHNPPEIIIFDEVDVGIGGRIASIVGEMLYKLGKVKQVICITHQPQTASFGDRHIFVSKHNKDSITLAEVEYLDDKKRIDEIARMLGGVKITPTTLSHAKEMLHNSKNSGGK